MAIVQPLVPSGGRHGRPAPRGRQVATHGSPGPSRCVFQVINPNLVPTPFAVAVCGLWLSLQGASSPRRCLAALGERADDDVGVPRSLGVRFDVSARALSSGACRLLAPPLVT